MVPPALVAVKSALSVAGTFLGKYWHFIAIGLLALTAYHLNNRAIHWHDQTEICQNARKADQATWTAAYEKAKADNLAQVRATETKWQGVVTETQDDLNAKLRDAYALANGYASRMRAALAANQGHPGSGGASPAAGTPGDPYGTGGDSLIPVPADDLRICAANTVKARGWQDFYKGLRTNQ